MVCKDLLFSDYSRDISEGGICVRSIEAMEPGAEVDIQLHLPDRSQPLRVKGVVVWSGPLHSEGEAVFSGVKFYELGPRERELIRGITGQA